MHSGPCAACSRCRLRPPGAAWCGLPWRLLDLQSASPPSRPYVECSLDSPASPPCGACSPCSMGGLVVKDLLVSAKAQKDERLRRWGLDCEQCARCAVRASRRWFLEPCCIYLLAAASHHCLSRHVVLAASRAFSQLVLTLCCPPPTTAGSTATQRERCFTLCLTLVHAWPTGAGECVARMVYRCT